MDAVPSQLRRLLLFEHASLLLHPHCRCSAPLSVLFALLGRQAIVRLLVIVQLLVARLVARRFIPREVLLGLVDAAGERAQPSVITPPIHAAIAGELLAREQLQDTAVPRPLVRCTVLELVAATRIPGHPSLVFASTIGLAGCVVRLPVVDQLFHAPFVVFRGGVPVAYVEVHIARTPRARP